MRLKEVVETTGLSKSSVLRELKKVGSDFPKPFRLTDSEKGKAPIGWLNSEIQEWILKKANERCFYS